MIATRLYKCLSGAAVVTSLGCVIFFAGHGFMPLAPILLVSRTRDPWSVNGLTLLGLRALAAALIVSDVLLVRRAYRVVATASLLGLTACALRTFYRSDDVALTLLTAVPFSLAVLWKLIFTWVSVDLDESMETGFPLQ